MKKTLVKPFLKWAGGKRWLVSSYSHLFRDLQFNNYFEPFLGSGAFFFALRPTSSVLADTNERLIETYQAIKGHPRLIETKLRIHQEMHSKEYYYEVRSQKKRSIAERAAQFIYLNRTCWNGLYRVNRRGEFNVPIGTKDNVILDSDDFRGVSMLLKGAKLIAQDFEETIDMAKEKDLIFVDPPYTVTHNNNGFLKYNEKIFTWEDQKRLKKALDRAILRGAQVIVLNAYHEAVIDLYKDFSSVTKLNRASVLSGKPKFRKMAEELIAFSWADL